jgi:DNA mismatch endonuclease (patch repair protein)
MIAMADTLTKEQRSYCMSRIRSKNTSVEVLLRKKLSELGLKFEAYYKDLPGNPDIVFPDKKVAVFVDGEFWHGKDFKKRKQTYNEYWRNKITRNMQRDKEVNKSLKKMGWKVLRIWGRDLKKDPNKYIEKIKNLVVT